MRTVRVLGMCLSGTDAELVTVEARFEPMERTRLEVSISGLPDPVIRESKGRLLAALEENCLHLPQGRLFVNLHPAGMRKAGEALDLPLALGAAAAVGHLTPTMLARTLFLGELGIDGRLHGVPGGLAAARAAAAAGVTRVVGAEATAREAAFWPGTQAFGARDLAEVVGWASSGQGLLPLAPLREPAEDAEGARAAAAALDAIRGQGTAKRALCAAAAGAHGLLFVGPPGTGKSLLARALHGLLPPPSFEERLEITRVLSAVGRWPGELARARPFRAPHHTASHAGLVGGGSPPAPGEITLAHAGLLFLDELPEFRRESLEALRQPLECGTITIARAGRRLELPARFQLVCAMNPCPCGYRGHSAIPCRCPPGEVFRYRRRISGPLLDRIELRLELPAPEVRELGEAPAPGERGVELLARVQAARERSRERQGPLANAELEAEALDRWAPLAGAARALLERAARGFGLSARAIQALRRVARTLADLEGSAGVEPRHLKEALALRAPLQ
jgi:magnesium chelatase family protein